MADGNIDGRKEQEPVDPRTRMLVVSVQESLLEKLYSETCCILQGEIRPSVGGAEERSRNWSRPEAGAFLLACDTYSDLPSYPCLPTFPW